MCNLGSQKAQNIEREIGHTHTHTIESDKDQERETVTSSLTRESSSAAEKCKEGYRGQYLPKLKEQKEPRQIKMTGKGVARETTAHANNSKILTRPRNSCGCITRINGK